MKSTLEKINEQKDVLIKLVAYNTLFIEKYKVMEFNKVKHNFFFF